MGKRLRESSANSFFVRLLKDYSINRETIFLYTLLICLITFNALVSVIRPIYQGKIVDIITTNNDSREEYFITLSIFLILLLANNALTSLQTHSIKVISEEMALRMRQAVVRKLGTIDTVYFLKTDFAQILPKIDKNIEVIKQYGINKIIVLLADILLLLAVVPKMMQLNWIITILLLTAFFLTPLFNKVFGEVIEKSSTGVLSQYKKLMSNIKNVFENWLMIRLFGCLAYSEKRFKENCEEYKRKINKSNRLVLLYSSVNTLIQVVTSLIIWGVGGYFIFHSKMTVGSILVFMGYQSVIMRPILEIASFYGDYNIAKASMKDYYLFLDEKETITVGKKQLEKIRYIDVDNVSFSYENEEANTVSILNRCSVSFVEGNIYLIHGESGEGKTTLMNLITGLLKQDSGIIKINRKKIDCIDKYSYWKNIGYTFQNPHFFEDSIEKNLNIHSTYTEDEIEKVTQLLDIYDEIVKMSGSWSCVIKNDPRNMSGGQLQRLDIVRNVMKNNSLLIFDEPTSNLDEIRRKYFYDMVRNLKLGRIVIIVSHDKEFENIADKSFLLKDGMILEV